MLAGIGGKLREERVRKGLSLEVISTQTRITTKFLHAIESEKDELLPGTVFTRNFVRQYASALGMDPEPLLTRLPRVDVESAPLPEPPANPTKRVPWDPRITAAISATLWLIAATSASVAAYVYYSRPKPVIAARQTVPAVAATPALKPVVSPDPLPAPPESEMESVPPAQAAPVTSAPGDDHPVQVVLTAREASWVKILVDGRLGFSGLLNARETRSVAADKLVLVTAGNAGGVDISLNGKLLDPLGPSGQVRTVNLTAEGPRFPMKTPPPAPPDQL
jgi:cytoskeletal protein RodZ